MQSGRRRFPGSFTTSTLARHSIRDNTNYPLQTQALAILLPRRGYATETSTHSSGAGGPPPGFNLDEAKRPLPTDKPGKPSQSNSPSVSKESDEQLGTSHKSAPTAIDKSRALHNASLTEL